MTAAEVKVSDWFMVNRNKKWYKKKRTGRVYTEAFQIGSQKKYLIPNNEPVMVRK